MPLPTFWSRLRSSLPALELTGYVPKIDRDQVDRFYVPLAQTLLIQYKNDKRWLCAIGGPPGSGKTVFAAVLSSVINALAEMNISSVIGLDAWHYPNRYLDTHTIVRDGREFPLRRIKGAPESFDAKTAYETLSAIARREQSTYPVYSRNLHEPIPDVGKIQTETRVILVEGNYLLLDEEPWRRFCELFRLSIFMEAPYAVLESALLERHQRFGRSPEEAEKHLKEVDLPNAHRIHAHRLPTDIIVYKSSASRIDQIERVTRLDTS